MAPSPPLSAALRARTPPEVLAYIDALHARIAHLEQQLASLRGQLRQDSSNSSRPPSTDSPAARARRRRG